jgi:hypothetical protein
MLTGKLLKGYGISYVLFKGDDVVSRGDFLSCGIDAIRVALPETMDIPAVSIETCFATHMELLGHK